MSELNSKLSELLDAGKVRFYEKSPVPELCSVCGTAIPENYVPLILWANQGKLMAIMHWFCIGQEDPDLFEHDELWDGPNE